VKVPGEKKKESMTKVTARGKGEGDKGLAWVSSIPMKVHEARRRTLKEMGAWIVSGGRNKTLEHRRDVWKGGGGGKRQTAKK